MSDQRAPEPGDEELVAFASKLLGAEGADYVDEDLLRETVREARGLWLLLYRVNQGDVPEP